MWPVASVCWLPGSCPLDCTTLICGPRASSNQFLVRHVRPALKFAGLYHSDMQSAMTARFTMKSE